jgi:colicin import membrane protein
MPTPEEEAAVKAAADKARDEAAQRQIEEARKATADAQAAAAKATAEADAARKAREEATAKATTTDTDEDADLKGLPKAVRDELVQARKGRREAEAAAKAAEQKAAQEEAAFRAKLTELEGRHNATEARLEIERLDRELHEAAPHVQAPEVREFLRAAYKASGSKEPIGTWLASDAVTKHPIHGPLAAAPRNVDDGTTTVRTAPPIGRGTRPGSPPVKGRVSVDAIRAARTPQAFDAIAEDWRKDLSDQIGRPVGGGGKRAKVRTGAGK